MRTLLFIFSLNACLFVVVFFINLNGFMRGKKTHYADVVLTVLWLSILFVWWFFFGWWNVLFVILLSLFYGAVTYSSAKNTAIKIRAKVI